MKNFKEWANFILGTNFENVLLPCQNALKKCTTKTGIGKSYIKKVYNRL